VNNDKVCPQCGRTYGSDDRFCTVDGASLVSSGTGSLIGTVVADRFLVHEKLGEGGMGEVYLAEHVRIRRKVALKLMRPWMIGDPVALGRFHREAENASQISHPNVAQVYDFGETADKLVYLAMEFVDGESLSKVLERERYLHLARTAEVVRQIGEALNAAHAMGILHRDLKPDNVMVGRTRFGTDMVKLVDFGIARAMNRTTQQFTSTGLIIGTPDYMSPEQLSGDTLDERSDLYALALIAYRALTGTGAYPEGGSGEALIARMTAPPRRLAGARPEILWPQSLQTAFDRALAANPADRFADPMEFVAELDTAVSQLPLGEEEQAYLIALSQRMPTPSRSGLAIDSGTGTRVVTPPTPTPPPMELSTPLRTQPRTVIPSVPTSPETDTPPALEEVPDEFFVMDRGVVDAPEGVETAATPAAALPRHARSRRPLIMRRGWAALIAIVASTLSNKSEATNGPVQTDSTAAAALDSMLIGSEAGRAALTPPATGTLPDSLLVPTLTRATLGLSSTNGSGVAVLVDRSGLALLAASLIPRDSVVYLYVAPDRMARAAVVTIDKSAGVATLLVPMQHCSRCQALRTAFAAPAVGDSVVMVAPVRRGLGRPVRGAVSSQDAQALHTTLSLRRTTSAPVVSARTGELLALSVGSQLSTTTMLQEAVARAKAVGGRAASDSLIPTWPDTPMPTSRLGVQAVANTEASIAAYQLPTDDITVLVMTPQVMKFRSREATFNPMAIQTPSKDPIALWTPWSAYVAERRAVVILDAAGNSASFPFTSGGDRRSDIRALRLYRGDTLVTPIETGRYPSVSGSGSVPWSRVAVYSPLEFRSRGTYRVEVDDARQRTTKIDVKVGTLEAIRKDLDVVFR
jgi:serine/threonine protein kinase